MARDPLTHLGSQRSLFSERFIGFMRGTALSAAAVTAAGVLTLGYARWEAQQPVLRRFTVPVTARPGFTGLSILHVSDLHMFPGQDFIIDFLAEVANTTTIDFVVSTGDNLGDASAAPLVLESLEPLLELPGAFVLGSNDYYSPLSKSPLDYLRPHRHVSATNRGQRNQPDLPWVEIAQTMTNAGWLDLSNSKGDITANGQLLALIGVDDPHIKRDRPPTPSERWNNPEALRIALTHAPYRRVLDSFAAEDADIIFAGHTHGGQVRLPLGGPIVTNCDLPRKAARGLSMWGPSVLHVSAGMGTSPFAPIRLACRPEVSLVNLVPSQ